MLQLIFNILFFTSVIAFTLSVYAFGGFDNSDIIALARGEKKVRYDVTVLHIEIAFFLLLFGVFVAILYGITYGQDREEHRFALYDLAIHTIAIGFIGFTIALYLPLMLPPIIGKTVQFTNLSKIPLLLIVLSLGLRTFGDLILAQGNSVPNIISHISSPITYELLYLSLGLSG
jgi:Ca2+/Na+ antiporter